jgi:hypothetical protein
MIITHSSDFQEKTVNCLHQKIIIFNIITKKSIFSVYSLHMRLISVQELLIFLHFIKKNQYLMKKKE